MSKNKNVTNQEIKINIEEEMSKSKSVMTYSRSARVDTEESEEAAKAWVSRHEQMFERDPTAGCWVENVIYSVPAVMMGNVDATKLFYPAVIGMGPLHFRCSEHVGAFTGGALRRIKEESISLIMEPYPPKNRKELMDKLVSLILKEEVTIKPSYGYSMRIPHFIEGKVFAWMMVVDACFLLVALSILSSKTPVAKEKWPALALLEDKVSLRTGDLLQDLLKMENQIPLWVVRKVAEQLPGWEPGAGEISKRVDMETVLTKLSPFRRSLSGVSGSSTSEWRKCYSQGKGTLLYVLLLFIIGDPQNHAKWEGGSDQSVPACKRTLDALGWIIPVPIRSLVKLSWEMLNETRTLTRQSPLLHRECPCPFHFAVNIVTMVAMLGVLAITLGLLLTGFLLLPLVVLLCLPLLLVVCMWREKHDDDEEDDDHHKGAQALVNSGVSIDTTRSSNISSVDWIQHRDRDGGKLRLPFLRLDEVAMVALWNMFILENCCPTLSKTKSLTNYIHLMSCVLASVDDLEPLRRKGVISIPPSDEQQHRANQLLLNWWSQLKNSAEVTDKGSTDDSSVDQTKGQQLRCCHAKNSAKVPHKRSTDDGTRTVHQTRISFAQFLKENTKSPTVLTRIKYWLRVLRNQYGSSPWMAISTVGAVMLLFLTATQVVCLFYLCIPTKG